MVNEIERLQNEILKHKERIQQLLQVQQQEQNQIIAKSGVIAYLQQKEKEVKDGSDNRKHKRNKKHNSKSNNKTVPQ